MAENTINNNGYRQALVHLAWFRDDQVRHLLFAMVELRPIEFPDARGCLLQIHRAKPKTRIYLHYRRFVLSVVDAIKWYQDAAKGHPVPLPHDPDNPKTGDGSDLNCGPFVHEPPWPQCLTSSELPFAPDSMNDARTHFLFPQDALPPEVTTIIQVPKNRAKLQDWLLFDLVDAYREYQGAMCVVAPNPVFRSIEKTHLNVPQAGAAETVAYKPVPRHGQCLNGLYLEITNERLNGRLPPVTHRFRKRTIAVLNFPTRIVREGRSVTHPEHGLLYWHKPLPLARSIHMSVQMTGRRKQVEVPARSPRRPPETYGVSEFVDVTDSVIGEPSDGTMSRIAAAESRRSRRQSAKDQDQEWFYHTPCDAIQYVRQRIRDARHSVLIVDPYFTRRELLSFGASISRRDVHLRVLTSTAAFRESHCGVTRTSSGSQLLHTLNTTFHDHSVKPEIRVLGDPPPIHDRFLAIDGRLWFSGNSLSAIGERAGVIVRLSDPETVIEGLEAFWNQAHTLVHWLTHRAAQEAAPTD